MDTTKNAGYILKTYHTIEAIEPAIWDALSKNQPFGSYRWHVFAETVMRDCQPFYLLAYQDGLAIGRVSFYLTPSEPIPLQPAILRQFAQWFFHHRPLMIGRTPFAGLSGLILPQPPAEEAILQLFCRAILEQARRLSASFVFFDFADASLLQNPGWEPQYKPLRIPDPGTQMEVCWADFESYLASLDKDGRYHYRRVQRKAAEIGIVIERHSSAQYLDTALALIQQVEKNHGSTPSPWTRTILENLSLVDATWLTARIEGQLVGCGLTLRDNDAQINLALGLAKDMPYAYFTLLYESIRIAIEQGVHFIRMGSGAYDVKRRMGFQVENNDHIVVTSTNIFFQKFLNLVT